MTVGPTSCQGPGKQEGTATAEPAGRFDGWQLSASYGQFWSHLKFDGGGQPDLRQQVVTGAVGYRVRDDMELRLSAGAIVEGSFGKPGQRQDLTPGWVISLQLVKQWISEDGFVPYLLTGFSLSSSMTKALNDDDAADRLVGSDFRFTLIVGYTFFDRWRLYLAPRGFGGPIFWIREDETLRGSDRYFFQAAGGTSITLPGNVVIFVEGSPGGEQAVVGGLAVVL